MLILRPVALLLLAPLASAQGPLHKLLPSDGAAGDFHGTSVSHDGTVVVVGAPFAGPADEGQVYVYDAATGQELLRLSAPDRKPDDRFGTTVATGGGYLAVAAPRSDGQALRTGAIYLFDLPTGAFLRKLLASDGEVYDELGWSLAIADGRVAAGTIAEGDLYNAYGAVYVFDLASGTELHKLSASDQGDGDWFGSAVVLDETRLVVGASRTKDYGPSGGAVYVYDVVTGQELDKLRPLDLVAPKHFGVALALENQRLLIGANVDGQAGYVAGAVYLFDLTTNTQVAKWTGSGAGPNAYFGGAVGLTPDRALVCSPNDPQLPPWAGMVYAFDPDTGEELFQLQTPIPDDLDFFGRALSVQGDSLLAGAAGDDTLGNLAGAAYLFRLSIGTSYCGPALDNSTGGPARIIAAGSASVSDNQLELRAKGLPQGQFGYFLVSGTQGFIHFPGGSQGDLCLGGTIGRFSKLVRNSGPTGTFHIDLDLGTFPPPLPQVVQPGDTWNFQAWFRDRNPGPTSNFTNALSITFE